MEFTCQPRGEAADGRRGLLVGFLRFLTVWAHRSPLELLETKKNVEECISGAKNMEFQTRRLLFDYFNQIQQLHLHPFL